MHGYVSISRSPRILKGVLLGAVLALASSIVPDLVPSKPADTVSALAGQPVVGVDQLSGPASAFRPINPIRVLDTRTDTRFGRLWVESAISLDPVTDTGVAAAAGVDPSQVTAVVVNVTMIRAAEELGPIAQVPTDLKGFGTVWPTGSTRLQTSTNNTEFAGHTIPNLVIAPLGVERKISFFSSTTSHVALDVLGVFVASGPTTAGRLQPISPTRAFDTRVEGTAEFVANERREIDLTGVGVPASATGVVMNVTAIRSKGGGFYRVWSGGDPEPQHSSVNVLGVDYQAGNQVISGVRNGKINVFTNVGGGLTIDVTGYFTGDVGTPSNAGLYVPITPGRLLDTRATSGSTAVTGGARLEAATGVTLQVAGQLEIPAGSASAVALNLTAIRSNERGFVKAFPNGGAAPGTSSLNFTTGNQTVPNHAVTSVDPSTGQVRFEVSTGTHLAVDATGYFLAEGATPPAPSPVGTRLVEPGSLVPSALPGSQPAPGPYDFLFDRGTYTATGGRPNPTIAASWPNCVPIRYAINVDLAESDAQVQVLIDSIEEMEFYTGVDFQYAGITSAGMNIDGPILLPETYTPELTDRTSDSQASAPFKYLPPDSNGAASVSLVIGFSNNADTLDLSDPGVIGVGGSLRDRSDSSGRAQSSRGFAVIDVVELYEDGPSGPATLANIKATTTHELGHMMGLGHVSDFDPRTGRPSTLFQGLDSNAGSWDSATLQDQLMYPSLNPAAGVDFDLGDQLGLWELYSSPYCPPGSGLSSSNDKPTDKVDEVDWKNLEVVKSDDDYG
jgi:hypothetical protein